MPTQVQHPQEPKHTKGELWNRTWREGHWYEASAKYSIEQLGEGNGRSCLIIGSPIFEAIGLQKYGWDVTYLDVRNPGMVPFKFVQGDAIDLPFQSNNFDAVSCDCVLCHVGLGRYGDAKQEDGDLVALREIYRVMKSGARAAVTFGPSFPGLNDTIILGTTHRIYRPESAVELAASVGFKTSELSTWCEGKWITEEEIDKKRNQIKKLVNERPDQSFSYTYISIILEKP